MADILLGGLSRLDSWVGTPEIPGKSQQPATGYGQERGSFHRLMVRLGVPNETLERWMPFTSAVTNRFEAPRAPSAPWQSPYDVDPSVRNLRFGDFPSAMRPFPWPYMIANIQNHMPMLDQLSMQWAWGKTPSGPGVLTPITVPTKAVYPQLPKVSG